MSSLNNETLEYLYRFRYITLEQKEQIARLHTNQVFSLHYELRWIIWTGTTLLLSGLSVFAYKTIYTIGQQVLILLLLLLSSTFVLLGRTKRPVVFPFISPESFSRSCILLGCLLFAIALGYWQYAFAPFESSWELVGLISGSLFLLMAYRFAHNGVLALALVCLGLSLALAVTPLHLILKGYLPRTDLISVGYAYGALVLTVGAFTNYLQLRKEFTHAYVHTAAHFLFVTTLAGLMTGDDRLLFTLILLILCYCGVYYARHACTFPLLLTTAVYGYIGTAYLLSRIITDPTLQTMYVLVTCAAVIVGVWTFRRSFQES